MTYEPQLPAVRSVFNPYRVTEPEFHLFDQGVKYFFLAVDKYHDHSPFMGVSHDL